MPVEKCDRHPPRFSSGIYKLYLDDVLFNVLALPKGATGRIGFLNHARGISELKAWAMTLPDEPASEAQR
jgi:hypothetical protein